MNGVPDNWYQNVIGYQCGDWPLSYLSTLCCSAWTDLPTWTCPRMRPGPGVVQIMKAIRIYWPWFTIGTWGPNLLGHMSSLFTLMSTLSSSFIISTLICKHSECDHNSDLWKSLWIIPSYYNFKSHRCSQDISREWFQNNPWPIVYHLRVKFQRRNPLRA